ncbi:Hsp90 co-chaperone Cdc37 OS=Schizosaccharomyces pombe (strain 972 / ATCC 24843) GN=cdc37 PE=1 SV=1 [Rhizoctonia solani AG-1 IB]|uniref:Hsp90 chaperone protein kinase-targeting subunit n=1 Tax=Thanatephorus cucumeris (strain AG1-IB / isolate 7/3/14) TaxID=1108050 RepID=A0A0B7FY71_THACB|nr:Hsp90 co-chaperone Cdc37 OS=Schizosaccharomyces pombe (strain 972 / ATCC 24843) GN=cdc37 PE=1 SV=1 [Rhizoctonia solani AG-1 IB]
MPLNYSKWDQLELSDDSDIEGHPNVDKRSLIRWKQRDIHEKQKIIADVQEGGKARFSAITEQLKVNPSADKPPGNAPNQPTYDMMLHELMLQVWNGVKEGGGTAEDLNLAEKLIAGLRDALEKQHHDDLQNQKDLEAEIKERNKHITSDDLRDGFDSTAVSHKPSPDPTLMAKPLVPKKEKMETIEVLNPKGKGKEVETQPTATAADDEDEDDMEPLPELTPLQAKFALLPLGDFEQAFQFIQNNHEIFSFGATDAFLLAGFRAQMKGESKYAKQCVNRSLMLQYCEKLGRDGVSLFFKRMLSDNPVGADGKHLAPNAMPRAIFEKDVNDTYEMICTRAEKAKEEDAKAGARETIQLVCENPDTDVQFNVPDGPPPETITLEGEGTEHLDPVQVREALMRRWEMFEAFKPEMQSALRNHSLDEVNAVLEKMDLAEAEGMVQLLDASGILSFSSTDIRDETGAPAPDPE